MKNFFKKITGLDKVEAEKAQVESDKMELLKQRDPKEYHTRKKEPWVNVIDVKVNEENVRNGFFELDWNEQFVLKLKQEGYGEDGDKDEEIVDRWFRELCANVVIDGDYGGPVNTGSLDMDTVKRNNQ